MGVTPGSNEILASATKVKKKPVLALTFDLPATYNSNPNKQTVGSADAGRFTPRVKLGWNRDYGRINLTAEIASYADEFEGTSTPDIAVASATFRATLGDRKKEWSPSIAYTPQKPFLGAFRDARPMFHDITVAVGRTLTVAKNSDGSGLTLALDGVYGRRESSDRLSRQHRPTVIADISGPLSKKKLRWRFKQQVQYRLYSANSHRRDWNLNTLAEIVCKLKETKEGQTIVASFGVSFERNFSNTAKKDFSTLDVGPKLSLGWKM